MFLWLRVLVLLVFDQLILALWTCSSKSQWNYVTKQNCSSHALEIKEKKGIRHQGPQIPSKAHS